MHRKRDRFSRIVLTLAGGAALVAGGVYLLTAEQHYAERREITSTLSALGAMGGAGHGLPRIRRRARLAAGARGPPLRRSGRGRDGASCLSHAHRREPSGLPIGEFVDGQGFAYATGPEHPLAGGGRVLVLPAPDGAKLIWSVDYTWRGIRPPRYSCGLTSCRDSFESWKPTCACWRHSSRCHPPAFIAFRRSLPTSSRCSSGRRNGGRARNC